MSKMKLSFLFSIIACITLHADDDAIFQPKSLLTTCFLIAVKNSNNTAEFDRCPLELREPLTALYQLHHEQDFNQEAFKTALRICAPLKIRNYFEHSPDTLAHLCWVIKNDAMNNIDLTLINMPCYSKNFFKNKKICIAALLSLGANINAKAYISGTTVLTRAIASPQARPNLVTFLINHGANIHIKYLDETPLSVAQNNNHSEIIKILYDHGAKDSDKYSAKNVGWHDRFCTIQ